ncbi:MAG TPA: FAD binding domain-containing protein, partial [Pedococcus sp.]
MIPAAFDYVAPTTVQEALAALAEAGDDAKVLAGGQSLVPAMNFRLAQPAVLVDLNGVSELAHVAVDGIGRAGAGPAPTRGGQNAPRVVLRIGAMTRQRTVERSAEVARLAPLLYRAMPFIAHPQIRNRGTIGGSLAHADPAAELPAVVAALGGEIVLRSTRRRRVLKA